MAKLKYLFIMLFMCIPWRHIRGAEVQLLSFLVSALVENLKSLMFFIVLTQHVWIFWQVRLSFVCLGLVSISRTCILTTSAAIEVMWMQANKTKLHRSGVHKFSKNFRHQSGDMKRVPIGGPINMSHHRTKSICMWTGTRRFVYPDAHCSKGVV